MKLSVMWSVWFVILAGCAEDKADTDKTEQRQKNLGPQELSLVLPAGDHTFEAQILAQISGHDEVGITAYCLLDLAREPKEDDDCWKSIESTEELTLEVGFRLDVDPAGSTHTLYLWLKNQHDQVSADYASASINYVGNKGPESDETKKQPSVADDPSNDTEQEPGSEQVSLPPGLTWLAVPKSQVYLSGSTTELAMFLLLSTEVSAAQFRLCVQAGACTYAQAENDASTYSNLVLADHPINLVTPEEAKNFCTWVGGRLPSVQEWYATANGGDDRLYPWGDRIPILGEPALSNCSELTCYDGSSLTAKVDSLTLGKGAYGHYHLVGNVAEWITVGASMRSIGSSYRDALLPIAQIIGQKESSNLTESENVGFRCAKPTDGSVQPISKRPKLDPLTKKLISLELIIATGTASTEDPKVEVTLTAHSTLPIVAYCLHENPETPVTDSSCWQAIDASTDLALSTTFTLTTGVGMRSLSGWVKDRSNAISEAASDTILLLKSDLLAPTITKFSVLPGLEVVTPQLQFEYRGEDDVAVTAVCLLSVAAPPPDDSTCWRALDQPGVRVQGNLAGSIEEEGSVTFHLYLRDAAGNTTSPTMQTVSKINPFITNQWLDIPGGTFRMGANPFNEGDTNSHPCAYEDEYPEHEVTLHPFRMLRYEVTNSEYERFLNLKGNTCPQGLCVDPYNADIKIHLIDTEWQVDAGFEHHPVVDLPHHATQGYCQWIGASLPSEAQWEYSARGEEAHLHVYPWGNTRPSIANTNKANCNEYDCHDGYTATAPVGSFPAGASPFGVEDLIGNAAEWTLDLYNDTFYNTPMAREVDPVNRSSVSSIHSIRGGHWLAQYWGDEIYGSNCGNCLRSSHRNACYSYTAGRVSFRCATPGYLVQANFLDNPITSGNDYSDRGTCTNTAAVYQGKALTVEDHTSTMLFTRCDDGGQAAQTTYWLVESDVPFPNELNLATYRQIVAGVWDSSVTLQVVGASIWQSATVLRDAPCDDTRHLMLITDSPEYRGQKVLYQYRAISFTKKCK